MHWKWRLVFRVSVVCVSAFCRFMPKLLCCPWPRGARRNDAMLETSMTSTAIVSSAMRELEEVSITETAAVSLPPRQPKEVAVRALVSARELVSSPYVHRVDAVITRWAGDVEQSGSFCKEKQRPTQVPRFASAAPSKEYTLPYAESDVSPVHLSPRSIIADPKDEDVPTGAASRRTPDSTPPSTPVLPSPAVYGTEPSLAMCERCLETAHPLLREPCVAWLRTFVAGLTSRLTEACFADGMLTLELTGARLPPDIRRALCRAWVTPSSGITCRALVGVGRSECS